MSKSGILAGQRHPMVLRTILLSTIDRKGLSCSPCARDRVVARERVASCSSL